MSIRTCTLLALAVALTAAAQTATVSLGTSRQTIRGFGGMNHKIWTGYDLNTSDRNIAFGNSEGQLGFTVLRIWISDKESEWSIELPTAKDVLARGGIVFATPWNPPAALCDTVNRNGRSEKRLKPANYAAYAAHLNKFVKYMKDNGVTISAISFANEPDWGYDWTWWSTDEVHAFAKDYAGALRTNGNKVITAESFAYAKKYYDQILGDSIASGNVDIIGTHFYASGASSPDSFYRYPLADAKASGKERWMTEHYTDSKGSADLWAGYIQTQDQGQAVRMDSVRALDVGYEIHRALVEGQFNAYVWWYLRRDYGPILNSTGKASKRGYVMAQFAKFVRPGWVRVEATKNPSPDVYVSAFRKGDSVAVVAINRGTSERPLSISVAGTKATAFDRYTTSASKSLAKDTTCSVASGAFATTLDGSSISTFVGTAFLSPSVGLGESAAIPKGAGNFEVFDLSGAHLGSIRGSSEAELRTALRGLAPRDGLYLLRERSSGTSIRLEVLR